MERAQFQGVLLDGRSARRRSVGVSVTPAALLIHGKGLFEAWPYAEITLLDDERRDGPRRLARGPARLSTEDAEFWAALLAAAPELMKRGRRARLAGLAVAAVAALALGGLLAVARPAAVMAARFLPPSWEERLGDAVVDQVARRRCTGEEGIAAIEQLTARLLAQRALPYRVRVVVVDLPHVNAFAAPGGRIAVLKGLLRRADSSEELAGVLAHELGHTIDRHTTTAFVHQAGLWVVMKALLGDRGGNVASNLIGVQYSRAAESEADANAVALLTEAGITTAGLKRFFTKIADAGETSSFLDTHPDPESRALGVPFIPGKAPALSQEEWLAVKNLCS